MRPGGGYFSSIGGVLGVRVLGAASSVLAARLLGPSDRGELGLLIFAIALGSIVATSGMDVWIARTVASDLSTAEEARDVARRHLGSVASVLLGLGVVLTMVGGLGALPSRYVDPEAAVLAVVMVAVTAWSMLRLAFLGAWRRMRRVAVAQTAGAATYATIVGALLVVDRPSITAVLAGAVLGTAVVAAATGVRLKPTTRTSADRSRLASARRFGLPVMVGELLSHATNRADLVVLVAMRGTDAVGIYVVAAALSELLWIVPNGVSQLMLPQVASDPDPERTCAIVALTTWVGIGGGIVISLAARPLISLAFGDEFGGAVGAVPALCVAAVAFGVWRILIADLAARGDSMVRVRASGLALLVMLALDVPLIALLDVPGAALASAVAYALAAIAVAARWSRHTAVPTQLLISPRLAIRSMRQLRARSGSALDASAQGPDGFSDATPRRDGHGDADASRPADGRPSA